MKVKDVVLVTGASKGIGKSISILLAKEGYNVVIFGRDVKNLNKLKIVLNEIGSDSLSFSGDVADENFVYKSIDAVIKHYGKIDCLINNAGVAYFESFVNSTLDQFKRQIDTNIIGVYLFCKATINHMIERKSGTIINISSLAGKNGFPTGSMYSATKHAVMGFSRSLLQEVRKHNVRVITVCPGSVVTDMILETSIHPKNLEQILQPEDVADVVLSTLKLPSRALVSEIEIRPNNP